MSDACLLLVGLIVEDALLQEPAVAQLVRQAAQVGLTIQAVGTERSPADIVDGAGLADVIAHWTLGADGLTQAITNSGADPARLLVLAADAGLVAAASNTGASVASDLPTAQQMFERFSA